MISTNEVNKLRKKVSTAKSNNHKSLEVTSNEIKKTHQDTLVSILAAEQLVRLGRRHGEEPLVFIMQNKEYRIHGSRLIEIK